MGTLEREPTVAFNIEYEKNAEDAGLYADVVSYLGEYRLKVQEYNYELRFSGNSESDLHVRDSLQGEPMYEKAKRALSEKRKKGEPTHREEAELEALGDPDNFKEHSLDYQLRFAKDGDILLWGSPPGPENEGYGNYGFIFKGNISKISPLETRLKMTAIRVDNPTLTQYNLALSDLIGQEITFRHEDDFLRRPFVKSGAIDDMDVGRILYKHFSFKTDPRNKQIFRRVIQKMDPSIREFIALVKTGTKEEKINAFYALENYALELKNRFEQEKDETVKYIDDYKAPSLYDLSLRYEGQRPPMVPGSCGSTKDGSINSNNVLMSSYERLMKAIFGEKEPFKCPRCGYETHESVGNECPSCHLTKEAYIESGGAACA